MLLTGELKELKEKVKTNSRKELQNLVKENRELSKKLEWQVVRVALQWAESRAGLVGRLLQMKDVL